MDDEVVYFQMDQGRPASVLPEYIVKILDFFGNSVVMRPAPHRSSTP
jgi:hypothetical protein